MQGSFGILPNCQPESPGGKQKGLDLTAVITRHANWLHLVSIERFDQFRRTTWTDDLKALLCGPSLNRCRIPVLKVCVSSAAQELLRVYPAQYAAVKTQTAAQTYRRSIALHLSVAQHKFGMQSVLRVYTEKKC